MQRVRLVAGFLTLGLAVWTVPAFLSGLAKAAYLSAVPAVLLFSALLLRRNRRARQYFPVFYAFFTASAASALEYFVVGEVSLRYRDGVLPPTVEGIVLQKLLSTVVIVATIAALTRASGAKMDTIYITRGRLSPGLLVGSVVFLLFLATSTESSALLFGGRDLTWGRVASWAAPILAYALANGVREELWFRGLFLRRYESLLDPGTANLLQALVFSSAHAGSRYSPILIAFILVTFLLGLAFGWAAKRTGSLVAPVLMHAGTDIPVVLGYFSSIQ